MNTQTTVMACLCSALQYKTDYHIKVCHNPETDQFDILTLNFSFCILLIIKNMMKWDKFLMLQYG